MDYDDYGQYDYDIDDSDEIKRIVPDTSAIIEGNVAKLIKEKELSYPEIIIPEAAIAELEHQANNQRPTGVKGLEEIKRLQEQAEIGEISINITGRRPTNFEKATAKLGEVDSLIRDVAREHRAMLITSDKIQAKTAEAQGIPVIYYEQEYKGNIDLKISKFFDKDTMSVHLKENIPPMAKKGKPGNIRLVQLAEEKFTYKQIENIAEEILEKERYDPKSYLEADMEGAIVVQSRDLRISIARPPFSEALEITAVRPVAKVTIDDYDLSEEIIDRFKNSARGILISGSPGAGKSTFAQAIAQFYDEKMHKIVKTMESPRDLQVADTITQYSPLEGDMENTADILLLVRPDFTIYDELRKNHDFEIFADMRLAGVGMIGVVHATRPIDAIQRIASRVDLGTIPSIVDTTIYIEDGEIAAIYENRLTVKVPTGMEERDLSRPVLEVVDFETGELVNEIYTYGDQTIVMDIGMVQASKAKKNSDKTPVQKIAEAEILRRLKRVVPKANLEVSLASDKRVNVYVEDKYKARIIGKQGKRINELEKEIGISINVDSLENSPNSFQKRLEKQAKKNKKSKKSKKDYFDQMIDYKLKMQEEEEFEDDIVYEKFEIIPDIRKDHVVLPIGKRHVGRSFDILIEDDFLFTATVGKKGSVKLNKNLDMADAIINAMKEDARIIAKVRD